MPRSKKPPGTAVDKRNGARVVTLTTRMVEEYPPPRGCTANARKAWKAYWQDRASYLLTPASKVVLERWAIALSRYERLTELGDAEPLLPGSQRPDSFIMNPAYRGAADQMSIVQACERQLGIGTYNATSLGLAAVAEQRSVSELNARYEQPESQQEGSKPARKAGTTVQGEVEDVDPRLVS